MVKSSFIGEIARYYADDYIIWKYLPGDVERIRRRAKPKSDLMVQRYVFLQNEGNGSFKKASFMFGLRGIIEIYRYTLGEEPPAGIADIAHLCCVARGRLAPSGKAETIG